MCVVSDLALARAYWNLRKHVDLLKRPLRLAYLDNLFDHLDHLESALSEMCPWICEDHVSRELNKFLRDHLLPSICHGTDDFELKYLNSDKKLGICRRLWTYVRGVMSSKSWQDGLLELFPQGSVDDGSMRTLFDCVFYWGIYATLSGSFSTGRATQKSVTLAATNWMAYFSGHCQACPFPADGLIQQATRAHTAALLIQRSWRRSISDPGMVLCKRRILRDCLQSGESPAVTLHSDRGRANDSPVMEM
jgi:hypothetical protein